MASKSSEDTKKAIEALTSPRVQNELALSIPGFDRAGLLSSLIEAWGGQEALAKTIWQEFQLASPGSMSRQRTLELICRMIGQHSDSEAVIAIDQMDDEALKHSILNFVEKLTEQQVGIQNAVPAAQEETAG